MIPYVELRAIPLVGGVSLAVFGTLVVIGVVAGVLVAESRARRHGIPIEHVHEAILWTVVPGFVGAHVAAVMPDLGSTFPRSPQRLLEYWSGMSSFGGFAAAGLGFAVHRLRHPRRAWLRLADILVQALVVGWVFGRLGCTLVHDHVGSRSDAWLAVAFPDGSRHDLGLYEFLFTSLVLVPVVILLNRRDRPPGTTIAWVAVLYGPARFVCDFWRHTDLPGADPRYLGLTMAQYGCVVLTGIGVSYARRVRRLGRAPR